MSFDANLLASLQGRGLDAFQSKRHLFVVLPALENGYFEIPTGLPEDRRIFMEVEERIDPSGITVACGIGGHALRAFHFPKQSEGGRERQAHFMVGVPCVTVEVSLSGFAKIYSHNTQAMNNNEARIETGRIWTGKNRALPGACWQYRAALEAALAKLKCIDCSCCHFCSNP